MWKLKKDKASLENKIDLVSVTPKKEISVKKEGFFLSGKGGYPPPLTESPLSFSGKFFPKRAKNDVFFIK